MGWKKVEVVVPPIFTKTEVVLGAVAGILLVIFLSFFGFNVFGHKPKKAEKVSPSLMVENFKSREGFVGRQQKYVISVLASTSAGGKIILPSEGCHDLMVVDLKYKAAESEKLNNELSVLEGVESVEVYQHKVIVRRPCISMSDLPQLWSWEEVWQNVLPVLKKY